MSAVTREELFIVKLIAEQMSAVTREELFSVKLIAE